MKIEQQIPMTPEQIAQIADDEARIAKIRERNILANKAAQAAQEKIKKRRMNLTTSVVSYIQTRHYRERSRLKL